MRNLVSIFVGGVQKAGTTSLFSHFCDHPALSRPSTKELHYFDDESRDWSGPDYGELEAYFDPRDGSALRFDVTPIYIFWPTSIARIRRYNPSAKLIFLFRDPFERAWSQWCHQYGAGYETMPFAQAIRAGRKRMWDCPPLSLEHRLFSYIERGQYARQVEHLFAHFPPGQLLFLRSEDLLSDHVATLARIAVFLGVPPFPDTGRKRENLRFPISYPSPPEQADMEFVADLLRDDVSRFSCLTGLDVTDWKVMRGSAGS